jgi:hypothetical protein
VTGLFKQLVFLAPDRTATEELNLMLAVIKDRKPRDQLELMLAAQLALSHIVAMRMGSQLLRAETVADHQLAEGSYNRIARTFTAQLDALNRHRSGSEQKVTVQHVQNVAVDGPAIVGNVTNAPIETAQPVAPPPVLTHDPQPTMPIISERRRAPVPARVRRT